MKKILSIIILLAGFLDMQGQSLSGDNIKLSNYLSLRGYRVTEITNDTALTSNSIMKLPTEYAVKQFVLNHLSSGYDGKVHILDAIGDTSTISTPKNGDVAIVLDSSKIYAYTTYWTYKTDIDLSNTNEIQTINLVGDVTGVGIDTIIAVIANDSVSNAKLANMASGTLKGRSTAGTGDPEDIIVGSGLTLAAGVLTAAGGGPATAGGFDTQVQINQSGILGALDSFVAITTSGSDRVGIGKISGLAARLHIQSQAVDDAPAILIDQSNGKRTFNANSQGGLTLGGIEANGSTGSLRLNRYSDGANYGTLWIDEIDSVFTVNANKNGLSLQSKGVAQMYITDAGINLSNGAYTPADLSAILDIRSTTKGLLPPRGTTTNRDAIASPANLLIFGNTTTGKLNYYNSGWKTILDSTAISGAYLPLIGGTLTGNLLFSADDTKDIGQSADFRPRTVYTGTAFTTSAAGKMNFTGRAGITSPADGIIRLANNAGNDFTRLDLGGTSSFFPAISKISGPGINVILADNTGQAGLAAGTMAIGTNTLPSGSILADFVSTTKGVRLPQLSTTQRNAIAGTNSIIISNTTTGKPNWFNTVTSSWEEPGTGSGTVTSIVASATSVGKGLSAVESPAGTYTIGLNLGSLGIISPLAASDTATYLVAQKASGFDNSKVMVKELVYDAYGEAYQNTELNLGVLTSNVEYDLKMASTGLNKLFDYNSSNGILKYNGTFTKNFIAQFNGVLHSAVVGEIWIKIYTAPATGSTWTLLTSCKVYLPSIGNTANFSCRRRVALSQGMRVKCVVWQQPTGTAYLDMGTFSVDGVTTN